MAVNGYSSDHHWTYAACPRSFSVTASIMRVKSLARAKLVFRRFRDDGPNLDFAAGRQNWEMSPRGRDRRPDTRSNATRRLSSGAVGRAGGETPTVGINAAVDARR